MTSRELRPKEGHSMKKRKEGWQQCEVFGVWPLTRRAGPYDEDHKGFEER